LRPNVRAGAYLKRSMSMSESPTVASFLATVPVLDGFETTELEELANVMRPREVPAGEVLWREGDEGKEMVLIVGGLVSVALNLPGERDVELSRLGPGEMLGEIPLLDGGRHSASARVLESAQLLSLSRADFDALVSRGRPTAIALKRRIAELTCARLRLQLTELARTLPAGGGHEFSTEPLQVFEDLESCGPPDSGYVRRLATFHAFDDMALWGFLTAGRFARCPAGSTLVVEGQPSTACYLTMNGAVEKVIIRGDRRIRVGLAGPGRAFGYEGLIDGGPAPVTAVTRERALLLVLPPKQFERLFGSETSAFLDVILRDLFATLRNAHRPHARLAASL
jgi:CRP-like cAMP-binding protein